MSVTRKSWEQTNRARELVLGVLRNSQDAMTAAEVFASIVDTELNSAMQTGVVLKFAAVDGLVDRTVNGGREVLWAITDAGRTWVPPPYDYRAAKALGMTRARQAKAQAPAVSAQGDLRPQNGHKPSPTHPYNVTPAVAKARRPAPVTRPLPAHLESKPDMAKKKEKPKTYADLRIAEIKGEELPVKTYPPSVLDALIKDVLPADEPPLALWIPNEPTQHTTITPEDKPMTATTEIQIDTSELIDMRDAAQQQLENLRLASQPIQPIRPACQGHCSNHAHASEEAEDAQTDRLAVHQVQIARDDYIVHLLTIADEHASTGDDLGVSPVWKTARRLAPIFGLEKTYA